MKRIVLTAFCATMMAFPVTGEAGGDKLGAAACTIPVQAGAISVWYAAEPHFQTNPSPSYISATRPSKRLFNLTSGHSICTASPLNPISEQAWHFTRCGGQAV